MVLNDLIPAPCRFAHPVAKGLLPSPHQRLRQILRKRLTQNVLLHPGRARLAPHLVFRWQIHRQRNHVLIGERDACFQPVARETLLTPQHIKPMNVLQHTNVGVFKGGGVLCQSEPTVSSQQLVRHITTEEDRVFPCFGNAFRQQPIPNRCTNGGDIVTLDLCNDFGYGV